MDDIFNLTVVLVSTAVSIVVPPLLVSRRLLPGAGWYESIFVACVLGFVSQGVLGLFWNHTISRMPGYEVILYYFLWLIFSLLFLYFRWPAPAERNTDKKHICLMLVGILTMAVIVRSIHPLQHFFLGQSDAYSHLHFLRDVVESGNIGNPVYPPGYHWILALPAVTFLLDPYEVARYAGAFFGAMLVLGVFVVVRSASDSASACLSAFLTACFPGFYLLQKTGVGAFANQLGLFFIPAVLYFYGRMIEEDFHWSSYCLLFCLSLVGFAASVPIMMVHIFIIMALERLVALLRTPTASVVQAMKAILCSIPALAILMFHVYRPKGAVMAITIPFLQGRADQIMLRKGQLTVLQLWSGISDHPFIQMLTDFLSFKRWGFGHVIFDIITIILIMMFVSVVYIGVNRNKTYVLLFGIWGLLTSIQSATGFLQFTAYQREGWSLLIVLACLAGIVGMSLYRWVFRQWKPVRPLAYLLLCSMVLWSMIKPPAHPNLNSAAEDDIIRIVRSLPVSAVKDSFSSGRGDGQNGGVGMVYESLSASLPVTVLTRNFSGWWTGQGELIKAVMRRPIAMNNQIITEQTSMGNVFQRDRQYIIFLDTEKTTDKQTGSSSPFGRTQTGPLVQRQKEIYNINKKIQDALENLSPREWRLKWIKTNENLTIAVAQPRLFPVEKNSSM